jgi:DNA gyrase/topoisomerase IV subunit B
MRNHEKVHINLLALLFLNKFAVDMIEDGLVSIIPPPLYGAIKGKKFIPIYKVEDTENYRSRNYEIRRFKGLGEMNPDQLELAVRSGVEYVIKYPGKEVIDNIINNVVNNTEVRKELMLKDVLKFDLILDQATKYAAQKQK